MTKLSFPFAAIKTSLEDNYVLHKAAYSSWAAPIAVIWKQNGSIRICADLSTLLDAAPEDNQHPLSWAKYIFAILNRGQYSTERYLSKAYLQTEVVRSHEIFSSSIHNVNSINIRGSSSVSKWLQQFFSMLWLL